MKKDCWICKEKNNWKQDKLKAAIALAKKQANEQGKTMAIIKEGCNYRIVAADGITGAIDYIPNN